MKRLATLAVYLLLPWLAFAYVPKCQNSASFIPATHTLAATSHHPNGLYNPSVTNTFTVSGQVTVTNNYDGAGYVTNRVFPGGRAQTLSWDALGRLVKVMEKSGAATNYVWTAVYDGLGRRVRTLQNPGGTNSAASLTVDSWFDPEVEFLEVAVEVNGQRTWKVYGPDLSGGYGGMQGAGGLEATVRESDGLTTGLLNDYQGNAVGTISSGTVSWNPARVNGYGPVRGIQAPVLSLSVSVAEASVWRGQRIEPTGLYWLGARYYDPVEGRFLSPDPLGHAASLSLYDFCGGDPVNCFDPDGRLAKGFAYAMGDVMDKYSTTTLNIMDAVLNPIVGLFDPIAAKNFSGGHDTGPSYSMYLNGSTASQIGYAAGYLAGEATVSAAMLVAGGGMGGIMEAAALRGAGGVGMETFMAQSAMRAESLSASETFASAPANIVRADFSAGVASESYLPYKQALNYNFDTFNESLGGPLRGNSASGAAESGDGLVNLASEGRTTHILTGDTSGGGHMFPGLPGKTAFPEGWSGPQIMHEVSDIATDPAAVRTVQSNGRILVTGTRNGVQINVVLEPASKGGGIVTAYPAR